MFRLAKHGLLQRETWPFALPFAASCGSVCSSGVKVLMATGRRRRQTFLNRMWSEAQLAVSNGHKHRPRRGRTAFTVVRFKVIRLLGYTDIPHNRKNPPPHNPTHHSPSSRTAYSVTAYRKFRSRWSLHMRLSKVRPLSGDGLDICTSYTKSADEPPLAARFAVNAFYLNIL